MHVVGVDGAPRGWLAAAWWPDEGRMTVRYHTTFAGLLANHTHAAHIAVDIPIGLTESGPRTCDVLARRALGKRGSSVFPAPIRPVLRYATHAEATARARDVQGTGVSIQAFGIYPKVAEVDDCLSPALQSWVVEVHPELSFWAMNGHEPMAHPKRTPDGYADRRALLLRHLAPVDVPERSAAARLAPPAGPDDVLDALAVAWSANRLVLRRAGWFPPEPEFDARGLRMEINW